MSEDLTPKEIKEITFSPVDNPEIISIMRMPDGNWRGLMQKNGELVQARQADPGHVLQMLLTHK